MKINQKYLEIGLVVLILIIGICAYNFGYRPYSEKADSMQTEINQLKDRQAVLESKIVKTEEFNENIKNADDIIDAILEKYGPGNTMEKVLWLVDDACNKCGITDKNISMSEPNVEFTSESVDEEGNPEVVIKRSVMNISYRTGYAANKNFVDYICNYPERMTIETMNVSYNQESGMLDTTMSINLYEVIDKNHEYVAPVIDDINIGSTNIFVSCEPVLELEEGLLTEDEPETGIEE